MNVQEVKEKYYLSNLPETIKGAFDRDLALIQMRIVRAASRGKKEIRIKVIERCNTIIGEDKATPSDSLKAEVSDKIVQKLKQDGFTIGDSIYDSYIIIKRSSVFFVKIIKISGWAY